MYNSADFSYIRSHRVSVYIRRNRPAKTLSFRVPCKYCEGRETGPGTFALQGECQVCSGSGKLTLEGSAENYMTCETCLGSGKDPDKTSRQPCHTCNGSGLAKTGIPIAVNNG